MSTTSDSTENMHSEQLAEYASELRNHIDDEAMLLDIHDAIRSLLSGNGASEGDIRAVLQRQFDDGAIREESFELVQQLIDRIVTEAMPTYSAANPDGDDEFSSTMVIPGPVIEEAVVEQHLQVGSVLRDRFMLQEEIAGGSMGTVYKALDRRLAEADTGDHVVAIKVLSPQLARDGNALRALQQEAAKTRCLSHPNIVRFIDLDRDDELFFMVMEWLEGRSLADILDNQTGKMLDVDSSLDIIRQLGLAVEYAHQRGVIHADIKPANVIITPAGEVKLFDFGVARIRQKQNDEQADFDPAVLKAMTPAYSSMQVLTGEDPVPADDVFSLGCLAYRLIAGYRVFGPRNAAQAAEAGMEPQPLENLGKGQWQAIRKALAFSRVARYATVNEFIDALLPNPEKPVALEDTVYRQAIEEPRRSFRPLVLFVVLLAVAVTAWQTGLLDNTALRDLTALIGDSEGEAADTPATDASALQSGATQTRVDETESVTEPAPVIEAPQQDVQEAVQTEFDRIAADESDDATESAAETEEGASPPAIDFSSLPPATHVVPLPGRGDTPAQLNLNLMEDGQPAIIDFVRGSQLGEPLALRIFERYYSGNGSAWESGQYLVSDDGLLTFQAGQHRTRTTISMSPDPLREPDREVTLAVSDATEPDVVFATVSITLQDDDQRSFENGLEPNTVAFAVSQVSVRERDSAVQIDLVRYKPDDNPLQVGYLIRDVTATEGDDYVDTGANSISFEPGQRSARILIPLVQDSNRENDEAFMLELTGEQPATESNIYRRIAVMIRDDDS